MKASDALTVVGLVLVALGFGLAYLPAGVVVAGVALLLIGIGLSGKKAGPVDR
jgi:hypothetical protein